MSSVSQTPGTNPVVPSPSPLSPPPVATSVTEPQVAVASTPLVGGEQPDRTISGIDLIDYGAGGLLSDRVYLLQGPSGVGKTIAALQFITRGLELGEPAVWVTDRRPENVLDQARTIGFQLDDAAKRGQLLILKTSSRYFDLVETPADVSAIIEELADHIREAGVRRLVIDPVFSIVNTSYSTHFAVSLAQSLVNGLEELSVTTLLVAGDHSDNELAPIGRLLEQNVAGVISMAPDRKTGGRIMTISKLPHASGEHLSAHYRILDNRGIINYRGDEEFVADVTRPWEESEANPRSVLVVGANPDTIRKVKEALGETYELTAESDLNRAVERVRTSKPAVVVVTPPPTGRVLPALIDLATGTSSAVVFLSQQANRLSDKVLYLRAGADDFMTEPFSPAEFRARVDALIRRGGRRLIERDPILSTIDIDAVRSLGDGANKGVRSELIALEGTAARFDGQFRERLARSIDTVSKLDVNFAVFWLKARAGDKTINRELAKLCRQEDVICRNSNGEFVTILPGADENGVRGFEARLREKSVNLDAVPHGSSVYVPGESVDEFKKRILG
jgi:KaiC/GvpD/RAD55 family RecA-like ATPase/CheY-like chemotaxis protein